MHLFPTREKTIVSSFSKEEVIARIAAKTQIIGSDLITERPSFNGHFDKSNFRLSLVVNYSQNYLPLVKGSVEDTSLGSIVFLRLRLFPAAKLYLLVFSVLAFFIALVFLFSSSLVGGIATFIIGIINYLLLTINFQRKASETITTLRSLLEP